MSRGPEAAFWKKVRRAWHGHAIRIEASDGEVDAGTPDTVLSCGGKGGFVELKVWPDNVSEVQLAWHIDAVSRGAYAMVLSELPSGRVWLGPAEGHDANVRTWRRAGSSKWAPEGVHLQVALSMIECALNGSGRSRRKSQ